VTFEARARASASRLVKHFSGGQHSIAFTKVGGTMPATSRTLTPTQASMTLKCTRPAPFQKELVDGERVRIDDVQVLISKGGPARTFELEPGLFATVDGKSYKVENVQDLAGGDVVHLRGNPT
jgi:hypothetical protein